MLEARNEWRKLYVSHQVSNAGLDVSIASMAHSIRTCTVLMSCPCPTTYLHANACLAPFHGDGYAMKSISLDGVWRTWGGQTVD